MNIVRFFFRKIGLLMALLLPLALAASAQKRAQKQVRAIDWPAFMRRQDMVWHDRLPDAWTNGPFLGNGLLGAQLYAPPDSNVVRIDVGRSDYEDHRDSTQQGFATRYPRLPIGYFLLRPVGKIQPGSSMRLDLYNAEATADLLTTKGRIHLRAYVHADKMLLVLETTATGQETGYGLRFRPLAAVSPRQQFGIDHQKPARIAPHYPANPAPRAGRDQEVRYREQTLLFGGQLTTAWTERRAGPARTVLITAVPSYPAATATAQATALLRAAAASGLAQLRQSHRRWWNAYFPQSFVSLPEARLENFYWIQMYKLAAATRADRALMDNQGPWLQPTPWPYATWNLNVQLSYWPLTRPTALAWGSRWPAACGSTAPPWPATCPCPTAREPMASAGPRAPIWWPPLKRPPARTRPKSAACPGPATTCGCTTATR